MRSYHLPALFRHRPLKLEDVHRCIPQHLFNQLWHSRRRRYRYRQIPRRHIPRRKRQPPHSLHLFSSDVRLQPWYITTFAVAEQLYDALIVWNNQAFITVTSTSLGFFQQFNTSLTIGTYDASSPTFTSLTTAIKNFADGFIAIAAQYTPSSGTLSEQFSRDNGTPLSAVNLTWSYVSALTAAAARAGQTSASWGATGLSVPSTCLTSIAPTVSVEFSVNASTVLGGTS